MKESHRIAIIQDFIKFAFRELDIKNSPKIKLVNDNKFAKDNKSFGGYVPSSSDLFVYIKNRNLADILRTLAHELVHHHQSESGEKDTMDGSTGSDTENEANSVAGVLLRKYGQMNPAIYESKNYVDMRLLKEDLQKYQIYCDMDGVLCDFDAQFDHFFGQDIASYEKEKGEKALKLAIDKAGVEFWSNMPWMPGGEELWKKIGKHGVIILSSPSIFDHAPEGKLKWIQQHLNPKPKEVIFKQAKHKHEVLNDKSEVEIEHSVLIDDYQKNLTPWKEMGGVAVKHNTGSQTSHILDEL